MAGEAWAETMEGPWEQPRLEPLSTQTSDGPNSPPATEDVVEAGMVAVVVQETEEVVRL